jgi:hypothetical protein
MTLVNADGTATIKTDKTDYSPEETVTIFGSGFLANAEVTVTVTRPDGNVNPPAWTVTSDESGNFETAYLLDGILGTYTVVATDVTNTAIITFTDAINTVTVLNTLPNFVSGQTGIPFSGTVTATSGQVPDGAPVELQYSTSSSFPTPSITIIQTSVSGGSFSDIFTAPSAGTYYFRAYFQVSTDRPSFLSTLVFECPNKSSATRLLSSIRG